MVGLEHGPAVLLHERAHGVQALESAKWVFDCHGGAGRVRVACIERGEHVGEHAHVCDGEGRVGLAAHEVRDGLLTAAWVRPVGRGPAPSPFQTAFLYIELITHVSPILYHIPYIISYNSYVGEGGGHSLYTANILLMLN